MLNPCLKVLVPTYSIFFSFASATGYPRPSLTEETIADPSVTRSLRASLFSSRQAAKTIGTTSLNKEQKNQVLKASKVNITVVEYIFSSAATEHKQFGFTPLHYWLHMFNNLSLRRVLEKYGDRITRFVESPPI